MPRPKIWAQRGPSTSSFPGGTRTPSKARRPSSFPLRYPLTRDHGSGIETGIMSHGDKGRRPQNRAPLFFFLQVLSGIPYLCTLAVYCCYVALTSTLDVHHAVFALLCSLCSLLFCVVSLARSSFQLFVREKVDEGWRDTSPCNLAAQFCAGFPRYLSSVMQDTFRSLGQQYRGDVRYVLGISLHLQTGSRSFST